MGMSSASAAASDRNPWLIGPWADALLFIATPLAILPLFHGLSLLVPIAVFKFLVLSVSATGHHLPGFIRAYTDPEIFRRFRARLLIVPALILLLAIVAVYYRLTYLFLLLIVWGTWHGILQVHGFLRIYDAKAGLHSRVMARLDLWMCLTWFIQVILWSSGKKMSILGTFYMSGGPLLPVQGVRAFEIAWLGLTVAVTAVYAGCSVRAALRGEFNPRKLAALAVALAFWAYCMIGVGNLLVGLLLWEIFHDVQYNAFVWSYNRGRVQRGLSGSRVEGFLFRGDFRRVALYVALIVAYGCIGFLSQDLIALYEGSRTYAGAWSRLGNIFACSALIHFYLDGFIWKVRDARVRADLGMAAAPIATAPAPQGAATRHWAFVAVLVVASLALGASERIYGAEAARREGMAANLAAIIPNNSYAHYLRATELAAAERPEEALAHYERAMALDAHFDFAISEVAELRLKLGDTAAALAAFEKARVLDPEDAMAVASLGDLYAATSRFAEAEAAYRALVLLDPENPGAHYGLAYALLRQDRGAEAKPHLERSLALAPDQPAALYYLGTLEQAGRNASRARELYEASLRLDPGFEQARDVLASLAASPTRHAAK